MTEVRLEEDRLCMHVDKYKSNLLQWTKLHGRIREPKKVSDDGSRQLSLCKRAGSSRMDSEFSLQEYNSGTTELPWKPK